MPNLSAFALLSVLLWMLFPEVRGHPARQPFPTQSVDRWEEFKSFDGRFRVLTPGPMTEKLDSVRTDIGRLAYHTFYYQTEKEEGEENLFYMVSYCDYPEETVHSDSTELLQEFFQATIEAATESVRGELLYSDDIRLEDYPGKIWRIDYLDGQAVIKTRAYMVGRRYYSVQTIMYRPMSLNRSSEKFLDSFRLLD